MRRNYVIHKSESGRACIIQAKGRYTICEMDLLPANWDVPEYQRKTKDDPLFSLFAMDLRISTLELVEQNLLIAEKLDSLRGDVELLRETLSKGDIR